MKGNNQMMLNQATMCEAVQYWLENKVFGQNNISPEVTVVKKASVAEGFFDVSLTSKEDDNE